MNRSLAQEDRRSAVSQFLRYRQLWSAVVVGLLSGNVACAEAAATTGDTNATTALKETAAAVGQTNDTKWAVAFGVGIIGDTTPGDYLSASFDRLEGPGEGLTYNVTVSYRVHEFDWEIKRRTFKPTLEVPFMLTLVDQKEGGLTPDVNLGVLFRWQDFPWSRYVHTTFGIGVGLSYACDVWTADEQRHSSDDERSNLKIWMPVEITFAAPRHPEHELFLFIDHQSGGHIIDPGGVDAWGFGYRFRF